MQRIARILLPSIAAILLLASCHSLPDHAKYIPKDALFVLGIHTGEMRQKLAWSAITGSNLLDELRKSGSGDKASAAIKDLENSGLDFSSTLYLFSRPDTRFSGNTKMEAVVPVKDAKKLTAYIQKYVPEAVVRTVNGRSETMIGDQAYLGWNDDVLIATNIAMRSVEHQAVQEMASSDTTVDAPMEEESYTYTEQVADSVTTIAEMQAAFTPQKDGSITGNSRFKKLETKGHDITMWVAYDALMENYGAKGVGMMGITMGNMLWKSSAMAAGFDFEKGQIEGDMLYYTSDSMKAIAKEFGKTNIDKDMLRRLPAGGLNMAAGYHLSPVAIRMVLDKMGLAGMANIALMQQGLSIDDILGAFSGDMVVAINNFRVETKIEEVDSSMEAYGMKPYPVTTPAMDFVYAMKIGDKAKVNKLLNLLKGTNMMQQTAPNTYTMVNSTNGATMIIGDQYIAAGSSAQSTQAFLNTTSGAMPEAVSKEISGHPVGMWADVHSFVAAAAPMAVNSPSDSVAYNAVRNMLTTFTAHGGEFSNGAVSYKMALNFTDKGENSLLQILHLVQQLAAADNRKEVASR